MKTTRLLSRLLPAAAFCLLLGGAHARPVDCSAEGQAGAARCVVATERVQPGRDPLSSGAIGPVAGTSLPTAMSGSARAFRVPGLGDDGPADASGDAARQDDPPLLALLLAAIAIVAFVAHRRGGG